MAPVSSTAGIGALWDADGRRVPGGALAPDPPSADGDDALSFSDVLSVINPLQHIPIVSSIYRWITGDTIKPAARVIGDALFGGPLGLVSSAMNAMIEQVTGSDIGEQMLAMVTGDKAPAKGMAADTQLAAQQPPDESAARTAPQADAATPPADPPAVPTLVEFPAKAAPSAAQATPAAVPAVTRATQGRPLAFYQANAGIHLAPIDTARDRAPQAPPAAAAVHPIAAPAAVNAAAAAPEAPPKTWFSATMLQGLDRYRAMQGAERARPRVDLSQ